MSTPEQEEVSSSETGQEQVGESPSNADSEDVEAVGSEEGASGAGSEAEEDLDIEVESPADPLAELTAKVAKLEAEKKENYDRFVRVTADLENFRKRTRRDIKDARIDARGKILKDMLPVVDNLERALSHAQQNESEATKSIIEGVSLVLRQFEQALERHSVKPVEAVGQPFDPALHEAVSQAPSADYPPGTVIAVLQRGYMIEDRLLRPALAVVSVAMPVPAASEESAEQGEDASAEDSAQSSGEASAGAEESGEDKE